VDRFVAKLVSAGVKFTSRGGSSFRAVTNRMVNAVDIEYVLTQIEIVCRALRQ
jgi:hypothetical protein